MVLRFYLIAPFQIMEVNVPAQAITNTTDTSQMQISWTNFRKQISILFAIPPSSPSAIEKPLLCCLITQNKIQAKSYL